MTYFHACPLITVVRVDRAGAALDVNVTKLQPADKVRVTRDGATLTIAAADQIDGDVLLDVRDVERPDHRDENVAGEIGMEYARRKAAQENRELRPGELEKAASLPLAAAIDGSDVEIIEDVPADGAGGVELVL